LLIVHINVSKLMIVEFCSANPILAVTSPMQGELFSNFAGQSFYN